MNSQMLVTVTTMQPGRVELRHTHRDGTVVACEYWVPTPRGYVRDEAGRQVCDGLLLRGAPLECSPSELADVIRREYRAMVANRAAA